MNNPVAPGRIRWTVASIAIAASALLPTVAEARGGRTSDLEVIGTCVRGCNMPSWGKNRLSLAIA